MVSSQLSAAKPPNRLTPRDSGPPLADPAPARRRSIPFRMLADAFGTRDEELDPEPDCADLVSWKPYR